MAIESRNVAKKTIANSFKGILRISPNNDIDSGLTDELVAVSDSVGNLTTIKVSNNKTEISNLTVNGTLLTGNTNINAENDEKLTVNAPVNFNKETIIKNELKISKGDNLTIIDGAHPSKGDFLLAQENGKYTKANFEDKVNEIFNSKTAGLVGARSVTLYYTNEGWKAYKDNEKPELSELSILSYPLNEEIDVDSLSTSIINLSNISPISIITEILVNPVTGLTSTTDYDNTWLWCETSNPIADNYMDGNAIWNISSGCKAFIVHTQDDNLKIQLLSGQLSSDSVERSKLYGTFVKNGTGTVTPYSDLLQNKVKNNRSGLIRLKMIYFKLPE